MQDSPRNIFPPEMIFPTSEKDVEEKSIGKSYKFWWISPCFYRFSFRGPLIASTDGTLFPTFSRFRGCDYFEKECQRIEITGLLPRIKRRVNRLPSLSLRK